MITRRKSILLHALLLPLVAAWAWGVVARGIAADRYRALDAPGRLEARNPARTSADVLAEAAVLSRGLFPPRHDLATDRLAGALARDPMNATLWFELAREKTLLGGADEARAALLRSDALDPRFPSQRMDAIELWALLGDNDRSVKVAEQLAALGGTYRPAALRKLTGLGHAPADLFDSLAIAALDDADLADALEALHTEDRAAMETLFAKVDLARLTSPEARGRVARLLVDPPLAAPAEALWRAHDPALRRTDAGVPFANPLLTTAPLGDPFPLGWQPLPAGAKAALRWSAPDEGGAHGSISATLTGADRTATLHWGFYRTILPPQAEAKVRIRLRAENARQAAAWAVRCAVDGELVAGEFEALGEGLPYAEVGFPIAPRPQAAVIQLILTTMPAAAKLDEPASVFVDGVSFE